MSNADVVNADSHIQLPRRGEIVAKTIDTTGRAIDLTTLPFNGQAYLSSRSDWVFINLKNESATTTIYYYGAPDNTITLNPALSVAAGTAVNGFVTTHPWFLLPGEERSYWINRNVDKFIHAICSSGTAILRICTSSDLPRAA